MGRRRSGGGWFQLPPLKPMSSESELRTAIALIESYEPPDDEQEKTRDRFLSFCRAHPDCLDRTCVHGHLTASALVIDAARTATLLTFHAKIRHWLQLGGHCDGEGDLRAVALREACEESGLSGLRCLPQIIDLDVHPIEEKGGRHLHYDVRFVVEAPQCEVPRRSAESIDLRWFELGQLAELALDSGLRRLISRGLPQAGAGS